MGIKDLYKVIKSRAPDSLETTHLSKLRGCRFAVDISIFLNKTVKSAGEDGWKDAFIHLLCVLKKHGIKTVCIFDGPNPPIEKKIEQAERRKQGASAVDRLAKARVLREKLIEEYVPFDLLLPEAFQEECKIIYGNPTKNLKIVDWAESTDALDAVTNVISRLERQTSPITKEIKDDAERIVRMMGLPTFKHDGEAEALCSYMAIYGYCDAVLTEDTDVFAYGAPWMVAFKDFKVSDEKVYAVNLSTILEGMEYNLDEFKDLCIMLRCDYNKHSGSLTGFPPDGRKRKKSVKIGMVGALSLMDEYRRMEEVVKHVDNPEVLIWERCREIFELPSKSQVRRMIKVMPHDEEPDMAEVTDFIRKNNMTTSPDYIAKCWEKATIVFEDTDDESSSTESSE